MSLHLFDELEILVLLVGHDVHVHLVDGLVLGHFWAEGPRVAGPTELGVAHLRGDHDPAVAVGHQVVALQGDLKNGLGICHNFFHS